MAQDIDIMRSLVRLASHFVRTDQFVNLHDVVEELWQSFREETNFLMEARNLNEFHAFHASTPGPFPVHVAFTELCTEHVVVMDYIDGISIAEPERLVKAGFDLADIGARIVDDYATQVLDDGFFHADPHAGNIILANGVIYFIDLGMMGHMSAHDRGVVKEIIFAVAENDVPRLKDAFVRFAVSRGDTSQIDHTAFLTDLDYIVQGLWRQQLKGPGYWAVLNVVGQSGAEVRD